MIRFLFISLLAGLLGGCASFQPVADTASTSTLILEHDNLPSPSYAAPVFSVSLPSYLNQSTVWYSDSDGQLQALADYVWAEPLSKAILRELSLALAHDTPYPANSRVEIRFARFILLSDGSGLAIAEAQTLTPEKNKNLPMIRIEQEDLWSPDDPETYLAGYRKLLQRVADQLSQQTAPTHPPH